MVSLRQRGQRAPAELYYEGNAALRLRHYAKAVAGTPSPSSSTRRFRRRTNNRAIAHAKRGNERECVNDVLSAWTLGYDAEDFWLTFFNHVDSALLTDGLTDTGLPPTLTDRLRSRAEEAVHRGTCVRSYRRVERA